MNRLVILALACAISALAQFNGYTYRSTVTIPASGLSGDLSNYPVVLQLSSGYLKSTGNGGYVESANGYDIIFSTDPTNLDGAQVLTQQTISYSATTGATKKFVNVPTYSAASTTVIYCFYGNSSIVASQDSTAVWDASTVRAYTFETLTTDSTSAARTLSTNGTVSQVNGIIGQAASFPGTNSAGYLYSAGATADNSSDWTVSAWVYLQSSPTNKYSIASHGATNSSAGHFYVYLDNATRQIGVDVPFVAGGVVTGATAVSLSTWHHVAASKSGTTYKVYLDGVLDGTATSSATPTLSGQFNIGSYIFAGASPVMKGYLDQVVYSSTVRSADWLKADYLMGSLSVTFSSPTLNITITSGPTFTGNSASSVRATWTTSGNGDSEIDCSADGGATYPYTVTVVEMVTSHDQILAGLPNASTQYLCRVQSSGAVSSSYTVSTLAGTSTTPLVGSFGAFTRYNDQYNGSNNLPNTGRHFSGDTLYATQLLDGSYIMQANDSTGAQASISGGRNISLYTLSSDLLTIANLNTMTAYGTVNQTGTDGYSWKSNAIASIGGVLYWPIYRLQFSEPYYHGKAWLITSSDSGATWTSPPDYTGSGLWPQGIMSSPTFLYYCQNDTVSCPTLHNNDLYHYLVSVNYDYSGVYLARVRKDKLSGLNTSDYQYFTGGNGLLDTSWSSSAGSATTIMPATHAPVNTMWVPQFGRYIAISCDTQKTNSSTNVFEYIFVYESQYPWGPWTLAGTHPIPVTPSGFYPAFGQALPWTLTTTDSGAKVTVLLDGSYEGSSGNPATNQYSPFWFELSLRPSVSSAPVRWRTNHVRGAAAAWSMDWTGNYSTTVPDVATGRYPITMPGSYRASYYLAGLGMFDGGTSFAGLTTTYTAALGDFTISAVWKASAGTTLLAKGANISITRTGANTYSVTVMGQTMTGLTFPDNAYGHIIVRRSGSAVTVYRSDSFTGATPTAIASATVGTATGTNALTIGTAISGTVAQVAVWDSALPDALLYRELQAVRQDMLSRGVTLP